MPSQGLVVSEVAYEARGELVDGVISRPAACEDAREGLAGRVPKARVPVVPALGERGMPVGFQPLPGEVLGLLVSVRDVLARDFRGAPVVAALAVGDFGQVRPTSMRTYN